MGTAYLAKEFKIYMNIQKKRFISVIPLKVAPSLSLTPQKTKKKFCVTGPSLCNYLQNKLRSFAFGLTRGMKLKLCLFSRFYEFQFLSYFCITLS